MNTVVLNGLLKYDTLLIYLKMTRRVKNGMTSITFFSQSIVINNYKIFIAGQLSVRMLKE